MKTAIIIASLVLAGCGQHQVKESTPVDILLNYGGARVDEDYGSEEYAHFKSDIWFIDATAIKNIGLPGCQDISTTVAYEQDFAGDKYQIIDAQVQCSISFSLFD